MADTFNTVETPQKQEDFTSFPADFNAPVYTQERMNFFDRTFGNLADATLDQALAHRVVRDVIRNNNLTEDDISIQTLMDGTAPILNNFNFRNTKTGEIFTGADLTAEQKAAIFSSEDKIFNYFARSPSGEKITPGKFGQGAKSMIIPSAVSFPSFYAGAKATNAFLNKVGVRPNNFWTAGLRVVAPVIGGTISSIAAYKPAQTANDYIFGEADVYLPDQAGAFKGGQTFMEGLGWLYAPYFFKGSIGANLITNFAESKKLGPRMARAVERGLATVQTEARNRKLRTALVETSGALGAAKSVEALSDAEGPLAEFLSEMAGSIIGGVSADVVLNRTIPTVRGAYQGVKKLSNKAFRKSMVDAATTKLGERNKAELAVYALEMISTVDDPDEVYRRLKWYTRSRDAVSAGRKIPNSPDEIVIEAKGKPGEKGYVPAVTEADLYREFGDIITETIDPKTGMPIDLPTALASNSLGFMLLQQANSGKSGGAAMQRRLNELGDKGDQAYSEFRSLMTDMIVAGFATDDKDMIGIAAELASRVFADDLESDLANAVNRYTDARKRLLKSDDPADILQASKELQKMVLQRLQVARSNEKKVWQQVPDFDINIGEFVNENGSLNTITLPNGDVVNAPNFVSSWLSMLPTDPKDRKSFLKDPQYKDLHEYVMGTLEEIGYDITPLADRKEAPEIETALKSYNNIRNQIIGSEYNLRVLDRLIERGEELSTVDAVQFWREQGLNLIENAKDYENPTLTRRIGRALEARANLQIARNEANRALENQVVAEGISSRSLSYRRSKLLAEARVAKNQGDDQKASFLSRMAEALLDDLDSSTSNVRSDEYHIARAYSAALNDAFTRPFTGKIIAKDKSGAFRITPESVIDTVFNSTFASERARAIDTLGKFEITQNLTNLLNLSPQEANTARDAYLGSLTNLSSAKQAEMREFAEQLDTVQPDSALRLIDTALQVPGTPQNEIEALQNLRALHEATTLAIGQNLESEQAGVLLDQIRTQAFDTTSGFINLPKLEELLKANEKLLDGAPRLKEALYTALNDTTTTRGVMETALRRMRDFGFDNEGKFSRASLERWMEGAEARGLLQAFPDLQNDLQRILETNGEYLKVIQNNKNRVQNAQSEQDWYYLLKEAAKNPDGTKTYIAPEDMALPFEKLFDNSQTKPGKLLEQFWGVAKNAPKSQVLDNGREVTQESAKRGFKTSLISAIMNQAGLQSKDKFSAIKAHELFFKPMPRSDNNITLAEWVVSNNVMTQDEVNQMNKLLTRIGEIDMLAASGKSLDADELAQRLGTGVELLASALGSATASKLYRAVGGDSTGTGSLAVVTRGSTAAVNRARQIMSDMPAALKADFFIEVLENPDLAIDLLETGQNAKRANTIAADIVNYVASRGFLYSKIPAPYVPEYASSESLRTLYKDEEEQRKIDAAVEQLKRGPNNVRGPRIQPRDPSLNPFLSTGGLPSNDEEASLRAIPTSPPVAQPRPAAVPAPVPQTTPPSPQAAARSRYAALFPNDPISGMIQQGQGIGSLL